MKIFMLLALFCCLFIQVVPVEAKQEKRNLPKSYEVERALEAAGDTHNPKYMDVEKVGSLELGDMYFHVFRGTLKSGDVRALVFDNEDHYLGYYLMGRGVKLGDVTRESFALLDGTGYYFMKVDSKLPAALETRAGSPVCVFTCAPGYSMPDKN